MKYFSVKLASIFIFFLSLENHAETAVIGLTINPTQIQKVDMLFSDWSKPDTPGAALAVIKDGEIIYRRGYGMADLERNAPNTPTTVFHVASMSKQFTAFAIQLLVDEGKLSLDDDVRKYIPELHDFGKTITIRHLIHHTSGLRDQWNLLALAGWRLQDVITEDDILNLIWRQKELNFQPGKEFAYSNTGYTLLGLIVKRVSGSSLAAFSKARIFEPLGMHHTHFQDDYSTLVNRRASSYELGPDGKYQYLALSYSNVGATSLFSTVEDLALWDQNFYDAKVGGPGVLAKMQTTGVLNSGKKLNYASGLFIGKYRGLNMIEHAGADAGFRTNLLRFPEQHFSVVILSNSGESNPDQLTKKVAEIFLDSLLMPKPKKQQESEKLERKEIKIDPSLLDAFVGDYALTPEFIISITRAGDQLMTQATAQSKFPIFPTSERSFFVKAFDAQFSFDLPGKDGIVAGAVLHQDGNDHVAKRIKRASMTIDDLKALEGEFYSDELHVLYAVTHEDGKLIINYPRGKIALSQIGRNAFYGDFPIGKLQYTCVDAKSCNSFTLSDDRVRNLRFAKVKIETVATSKEKALIAAQIADMNNLIPPFKTVPAYLRGSMNQWGVRDKILAIEKNKFGVDIVLNKGNYEFKVGSENFTDIDFGGNFGDASIRLNSSNKMESAGENFSIDVPHDGTYSFTIDITDPHAPIITVKDIARNL